MARVNVFGMGLWEHLERVPELEPQAANAILSLFLERACVSSHIGNICIERYGIAALPREWVLANIEFLAKPLLEAGDEWEWRRLLEVYWSLDEGLMRKLSLRAIASEHGEVREAGQDFLGLKPILPLLPISVE